MGKKYGPSKNQDLFCSGCKEFNVWWNCGPSLFAKCDKVDKYIPGDHQPGRACDIRTPKWCPALKKPKPV